MENSKNYYLKEINYLISICIDGEKGYEKASEITTNPELKTLFSKYASVRSEFLSQLQSIILSFGYTPDKDGGIVGALHRAWIEVKEAFNDHDSKALLESCERGERVAIVAYKNFLEQEGISKPSIQSGVLNLDYPSGNREFDMHNPHSQPIFTAKDASLISGDPTFSELPQDAPPIDASFDENGYQPIDQAEAHKILEIVQSQYSEILRNYNTLHTLIEGVPS